jgi:uncharacterized protein (DUF1697 family)
MASTHVALLRGINLGGKNKLPMKDLANLFTEAGCTEVCTYIHSGNVVFKAKPSVLKNLAIRITERITESFGYRIPVVLRTSREIADTIALNPYLRPDADENAHHMMFLADVPTAEKIAKLDPQRSPGDEFSVRGRDVYMYLRNGAVETRLTNAWLDKKLGTVSTARNWRTVLKLHEMLNSTDPK